MPTIAITGTRGIPASYGGFETFAEEISGRLVKEGFEVMVQCDYRQDQITEFNGVRLFYSRVTKSSNPLLYYANGLLRGLKDADIILVTGTGGSVFYFINLFFRKIIITNTDGLESGRMKWSLPKRWYVKLSEYIAVRLSDHLIADSRAVSDYLIKQYPYAERKITVAEYGAYINKASDQKLLACYGIKPDKYLLVVSRLEPENNLVMILEGYIESETDNQIVIVGPVGDNDYSRMLKKKYSAPGIIFAGGIWERSILNSLRYNCTAYIHGHSVGGTNPSLLEAMGNGNLIICHDNVFNREVTSGMQFYFSSAGELSSVIQHIGIMPENEKEIYRKKSLERISSYYNWETVLKKYSGIFRKFLHETAE